MLSLPPLKRTRPRQANSRRRLHVETLEPRMVLTAGPIVINEFLADNDEATVDSDGDSSDYIELFNPTDQTIDIGGWHLTDDASDLAKWTFPSISMSPGEYLLVYASSKDRTDPAAELHTNFGLSAAGEYLALVEDDGSTIAHEFAPEFPEQYEDIAYGLAQDVTTVLAEGAAAEYLIPNSSHASLGTSWTTPSFDDSSWNSGTTGLGYSANTANFDVTYIESNTNLSSLSVADQVIATPSMQSTVVETTAEVINYYSTGNGDNFANNNPFPTQTLGMNFDDFLIDATAQVIIPQAGDWTFGVNSDDGFRLDIAGHGESFSIEFSGLRGARDTLGTFTAPTAGVYSLRLVAFEQFGGASAEMFAAQGNHTSYNQDFRLIGDVAGGGLEAVSFGGSIGTDVGPLMQGVNSSLYTRIDFDIADPDQYDALALNVKYDDGFVAYLNGVQIVRRNAPPSTTWNSTSSSERDPELATTFETVNLTPFRSLLIDGPNLLAIHGLNFNSADDEFLISAEVQGIKNAPAERYFSQPSPGLPNSGAFISFVADTKFSVDRGFYDDPFLLDITTATTGATIRYTTDGSEPTLSNGSTFNSTLTIDHTTTLRARAYRTGFEPTDIDTQSYFFLDDILQQSPDGTAPAGWPTGPVNGQVLDYGLDPEIVNDPVWGPQLRDALTSISTVSLVTDLDNLLGPENGIYTHARSRGRDWERATSVELIAPNGSEEGFQHDSGVRIRGGFSRNPGNPKHSFRLFFRNDYDGELRYDLFGEEGVDVFYNLDLRTSQNYSWSNGGDSRNTINRDVFSRDLMRDLQQPYTRSRYYHLYLNGQYWGLYQSEERPEAEFAETYFGGDEDNYDVVKSAGSSAGYTIEATDGTLDAWHSLYQQSRDAYIAWEASSPDVEDRTYDESVYFRLQGLQPDGTRDPDLPVLLDVDNLVDYMIMIFYGGNRDSPLSDFLGNARPNNWFSIYDRTGEEGFKFMAHDSEHTLLNVGESRVGPFFHPNQNNLAYSNPQWLHQDLTASPEYRLRFADRVQQHFFNEGALTPQPGIDRFLSRADELSLPIIGESARWGDAKRATPRTKNDWQNAIDNIANNYLPIRSDIVLNQLIGVDLYPSAAENNTPEYRVNGTPMHGGQIGESDQVSIASASSFQPSTLINLGADWHYLANGSNQGTAWRNLSFNDNSWASGPAELGYGDGGEATTVSFGPNGNNKYVTTYFRHEFSVSNPAQFDSLALQLQRDDGAVVYLNGQEIVRSNMPGGTINFDTFASGTVGGGNESALQSFSVDSSLLVAGNNVVAVEIHLSVPNSPDISFNLSLVGLIPTSENEVYYTTNGTDPRQVNGSVNPAAILYNNSAFTLPQSTHLQARSYDSQTGIWSPLANAQFFLHEAASATNLAVTEINYNPHDPTDNELALDPNLNNDDFEFLELRNIGPNTIDLTGVQIVDGVDFTFPADSQSVLAPGEYLVVVSNPQAFTTRYDDNATIAGTYSGSLSNSGEELEAIDRFGQTIFQFEYNDGGSWPGRADGDGSSLEHLDSDLSYEDSDNWESSTAFGGTPGSGRLLDSRDVLINEVLTHTDLPLTDSIEIINTTGQAIDISNWWLSDDQANYASYVVPAGTILPAGGYLVLDENDFNQSGGTSPDDFALGSAHGDQLWLVATTGGNPTRFADNVEFGAAPNGESFGRWPNAVGDLYPMTSRSFGSANPGPRVGPLVISELMYNPPPPAGGASDDHLEYVEIHNPTGSTVDLTHWTLNGVDFDFPAGQTLAAGGVLLVTAFDPTDPADAPLLADFESTYGISASNVTILGPYSGQLNNGGEKITLFRADEPPAEEPDFYPQLLEDQADYNNTAPWPGSPDSGGHSLTRIACGAWGNDPGNWVGQAPTPGAASCSEPSQVVGRHIFYNNSAFDSYNAGSNPADDLSIATDKQPLLPGGTATFANYTSAVSGITGIMLDIDQLPDGGQVGPADFEFRQGNSQNTSSWSTAPLPSSLGIRFNGGVAGGDRISFLWAAGAIRGQWLEVRVKATGNTGLAADDLFYFGNAPGESGNSTANAQVNGVDFQAVRNNPHTFLNPAGVGNAYDFNRDRRVNATDLLIVRNSTTNVADRLVMLDFSAALLESAPASKVLNTESLATEESGADVMLVGVDQPNKLAARPIARRELVFASAPGSQLNDSIDLYLADYQPQRTYPSSHIEPEATEVEELALLELLEELALSLNS